MGHGELTIKYQLARALCMYACTNHRSATIPGVISNTPINITTWNLPNSLRLEHLHAPVQGRLQVAFSLFQLGLLLAQSSAFLGQSFPFFGQLGFFFFGQFLLLFQSLLVPILLLFGFFWPDKYYFFCHDFVLICMAGYSYRLVTKKYSTLIDIIFFIQGMRIRF